MTTKIVSDCGAVSLLSAIFGVDENKLKAHFGLLPVLPEPQCACCAKVIVGLGLRYKGYFFCNEDCKHRFYFIEIACSECGTLFKRRICKALWHINHKNQQLFFCNRYCLGKFAGKTYGFRVHPENTSHNRKWDYTKVYELKDSLGWGAWRIGKALNMPCPTVTSILAKRRQDGNWNVTDK